VLDERTQKVVLFGRKTYVFIAHPDVAANKIDGQISNPKNWPFAMNLKLVTKCFADSGELSLVGVKRHHKFKLPCPLMMLWTAPLDVVCYNAAPYGTPMPQVRAPSTAS